MSKTATFTTSMGTFKAEVRTLQRIECFLVLTGSKKIFFARAGESYLSTNFFLTLLPPLPYLVLAVF